MENFSLPKKLTGKAFSLKQALDQGLTKYALQQQLRNGSLTRLTRGVYKASSDEALDMESQYQAATIQCGLPSCVCLLSALEYYQVTDQISNKIWMLVPNEKRVRSKNLKLIRSRNPQWSLGILKGKTYSITTLERTLIECLLYKSLIGSQVALEAIKKAVLQKKVKLGKLYDMAKKMGVEHRVRSYIEALSV